MNLRLTKINDMKLRTKFMLAVGLVLVFLTIVDIWLGMKSEKKIMMDDIKRWTFIFGENVRVSLNTLMREGKMDIRFAMFEGMAKEIKGLENVRIIRSKKVDEIFMLGNQKDVIPKEKKAIKSYTQEISELKNGLSETRDEDEREEIQEEIDFLKGNIAKAKKGIKEAKEVKKIDKRELPIDDLDRQVLSTGESIYRFTGDSARVLIPYKVLKKGCSETSGCHKYAKEGDVLGAINMEFSIAEVNGEIKRNNILTAFSGIVKLAIIFVVIALVLTVSITNPIKDVSEMLKSIADGRGDLTKRLDVKSSDEVGTLSRWFNTFVEGMQILIRDIFGTAEAISSLSEDVSRSSKALHESAQAQMNAIDETSSSIEEMNSSISSVAGDAEDLMKSTDNASASSLEMLASISEVDENTNQLSIAVDKTASSITEIAAALKQVSSNVDTLFGETDKVVSSVTEINIAVKEVASHAREKAILAEKVRTDASSLGMDAVNKTRSGMEKIRDEVNSTASIINRLEERSVEIGRIVGVIEEITETTNLLSLNAAIIAAQAGDQGKSFAVVAGEVKSLARNTAKSTKEISKLIELVQEEVALAKESMESSSNSVEEGVKLSNAANEALAKIIESAESSLEMAQKVEQATEEQTKGLDHVAGAIHKVNDMVEGIKRATDEQKNVADEILQATEEMSNTTHNVKRSTSEQSKQSAYIADQVTTISHRMEATAHAMSEQREASGRIVMSIEIMKDQMANNLKLSDELDRSVAELEGQKSSLKEKVDNFKV